MRYVSTMTGFYTDPDLESWSLRAMWFYRYLYENDHCHGITGIGRINARTMCAEARMTPAQIEAAKAEIGDKVRWYADGTYWVKGRAGHTCFTSGGEPSVLHVKGAWNLLRSLPEEIERDFFARYPQLRKGYTRGIEGASKGYQQTTTESVNDAVNEAVNNPPPAPAREDSSPKETGHGMDADGRPAPSYGIDQNTKMLADRFSELAKWPRRSWHVVYRHFADAIREDHVKADDIQAAIDKHAKIGSKPWEVLDAMNGRTATERGQDPERPFARRPR